MVINRLKPDASLKTRVFMAALLWTCIGLMLMVRGGYAVVGSGHEWLLVVALAIGTLKARVILDRVAVKNMRRIFEKGEFSCLGGVYSWKTWLLIVAMISLGRFLRASTLQEWLVGLIYMTVGCSLLWSSRKVWAKMHHLSGRVDPLNDCEQKDEE